MILTDLTVDLVIIRLLYVKIFLGDYLDPLIFIIVYLIIKDSVCVKKEIEIIKADNRLHTII